MDAMRNNRETFAASTAQKSEGFEPIVVSDPPPDAPPPPDNIHPWNWVNGRWIWIPTDTGDGVPKKLSFPKKALTLTRFGVLRLQ